MQPVSGLPGGMHLQWEWEIPWPPDWWNAIDRAGGCSVCSQMAWLVSCDRQSLCMHTPSIAGIVLALNLNATCMHFEKLNM